MNWIGLGIVILLAFLVIGYSVICLAAQIDQERKDRYGERRS